MGTTKTALSLVVSTFLCLALASPAARAETQTDLLLVLAVDASGSVDDREFALQLSGIAAGFRDEEVIAAIQSGPLGRIGVTLAIWAEANRPKDALAWHVVHDAASAAAFARQVEAYRRRIPAGGTGIGKAVQFSIGLMESSGLASPRRVIDVSGDGVETRFREWSVPVRQARIMALARGITINGLAILNEEPELEAYYRRELIAGSEAFTLATNSYQDFAAAMRTKLIREIEYRSKVSQLGKAQR